MTIGKKCQEASCKPRTSNLACQVTRSDYRHKQALENCPDERHHLLSHGLRVLCIDVQSALERKLQAEETIRDARIKAVLSFRKVTSSTSTEKPTAFNSKLPKYQLDASKQTALSDLVINHGFRLQQVVELSRGQTKSDPRPNKALSPRRPQQLLRGYQHCELVCRAATIGIDPEWATHQPKQVHIPQNHRSEDRHLNTIVRSIHEGQVGGQYMVLNESVLDHITKIQISPLEAVPKFNTDTQLETRLIHDLSYPIVNSTNDASVKCRGSALPSRGSSSKTERGMLRTGPVYKGAYPERQCERSIQASYADRIKCSLDGSSDPEAKIHNH